MTSPPPARVLGPDGSLPQGNVKRRAVAAMFDRVAPGYERMNRIISLGLDRRWRRRVIETLDLPAGSLVLDLACGTGDLCRDLEAQGHRAVGLDLSAGMLSAARTAAPLVRGDAASLPFPGGTFDGVVCGFGLRNFVALDGAFAECARALRRAGRLVALDASVPERRLLRAGNALWFRGAVPVLGRLLARDAGAYRYLPRSLDYLPEPAELVACLARSGFAGTERTTLTGGSVQLLSGTRA